MHQTIFYNMTIMTLYKIFLYALKAPDTKDNILEDLNTSLDYLGLKWNFKGKMSYIL